MLLLEIGQKPVLVQVVRLGQPTGKCRPVRVSLKGPATVHSILKLRIHQNSKAQLDIIAKFTSALTRHPRSVLGTKNW